MVANVILICGLPGSGKTTLINKCLAILHDKLKINVVLVSYDELIDAITCNYNSSEWKGRRKLLLSTVEKLILKIIQLDEKITQVEEFSQEYLNIIVKQTYKFQSDFTVFLLDDNFYYKSMRYEWFQLSRKYGLGFGQIFLDCDLNLALHRNKLRNNPVPDVVIQKMHLKAEWPKKEAQEKWEHHLLYLQAQDEIDKMVIKVINLFEETCKDPVPLNINNKLRKENSRLECLKNTFHQADICLRMLVKKFIADSKDQGKDINRISIQVSSIKKDILNDLKSREDILVISDNLVLNKTVTELFENYVCRI